MTQTLAIFRKDVRFLRLPIALSITMTAAFAWSQSADRDAARSSLAGLLVLFWWGLAAAAIFKERAAGDRQFWTTRPYRASSLIAAKALFLAVFIHVPLLASDLAILSAKRFTPSTSTLLVRQFGAAALVTLPAAVLAAVTTSFGAMAAASVALLGATTVLLMVVDNIRQAGLFEEWLRGALVLLFLFVAGVATLIWQYCRRHTPISIAIAISGFVLAALAAATQYSAPVTLAGEPAALRSVHLGAEPMSALNPGIHLRIEGVPPGMRPAADAIAVSYRGDGVPWNSGWRSHFGGVSGPPVSWQTGSDGAAITIYTQPAGELGRIHISALVSIFGAMTSETLPSDGRPHDSALGRCTVDSGVNFFVERCRNSHFPTRLAEFDGVRMLTHPTYYIEYLSASPIVEFSGYSSGEVRKPRAPVILKTGPLIGHVRREIDIRIEAPR